MATVVGARRIGDPRGRPTGRVGIRKRMLRGDAGTPIMNTDIVVGNAASNAVASLSKGFIVSVPIKTALDISCVGVGAGRLAVARGLVRGVGSLGICLRKRVAAGARRIIMMNCKNNRRTSSRIPIFRIIRRVPRFPNNVKRYLGFLKGGVGCPIRTRGTKMRKGIVMRFMIRGSNGVTGPGIIEDVSPSLSNRTVQIVSVVPG